MPGSVLGVALAEAPPAGVPLLSLAGPFARLLAAVAVAALAVGPGGSLGPEGSRR